MTNPNLLNDKGYAPIHEVASACEAKNAEIKKILAEGGELDLRSRNGRTALHYACYSGNHHIAKLLLSLGADANAEDDEGYTPIFMAVEGCNAVILLLADAGADINKVSHKKTAPIHNACKIGKLGAIKNLIALGASLEGELHAEKSLIRLVIESFKNVFPSSALQMVRMLIKGGAEVGVCDVITGESELHLVAEMSIDRYNGDKYGEIMKILINAGSNPWLRDQRARTPISMVNERIVEVMKPALKKYIKKKEIAIVTKIETVLELKAFFFNQSKLGKPEVYELLTEGAPAKKYFEEALNLPGVTIDNHA